MDGTIAIAKILCLGQQSCKIMLRYLYEHLLESDISGAPVPKCLAIVLNPGDLDDAGLEIVIKMIAWCDAAGIRNVLLYSAEDSAETYDRLVARLSNAQAEISVHTNEGILDVGWGGRTKLQISLGYGGKQEVSQAIKKLLRDVENGRIGSDDIDEKAIEANLRFNLKPDLVIRAGGKQLSDFMIWQAAYSELYFTEVNWKSMRKIDFLRAIRDYQRRVRRFGK
jgi:undecaprenyl diphosphate synthase